MFQFLSYSLLSIIIDASNSEYLLCSTEVNLLQGEDGLCFIR